MILYYETNNTDTLAHWGIKGQKWGIRRFQNEDGTLTPAGKKRYGVQADGTLSKRGQKRYINDMWDDDADNRYKKDLERAHEEAIMRGNSSDARYIREAYYEKPRMLVETMGNGILTAGLSTAIAAARGKRGKELAMSALKGGLGGMAWGAFVQGGYSGRGKLIAEHEYGVKRVGADRDKWAERSKGTFTTKTDS